MSGVEMFDQMKMRGRTRKEREDEEETKISFIFGVLLLMALLGLYAIAYAIDVSLPAPLGISDEVCCVLKIIAMETWVSQKNIYTEELM